MAQLSTDRQTLVDAAFAILREGGSSALTARRVAARAGTAVGSVYTAFESLEALRLQANAITMALLRDHLARALEACRRGTVEEKLLCLADSYIGFADVHRPIWAALFEPRSLPAPSALTDDISDLFVLLEGVLLETGHASGQAAAVLARALWSSVHGTVYLAEIGSLGPIGRDDVPAMIHALVRVVTHGLASDPTASPSASGG